MPPLATNCVRGKGSFGVQASRSASRVKRLYEEAERGRKSATLGHGASDVHPPSNFTLSIVVELFHYARRLNQAFQSVGGGVNASMLLARNIHGRSCVPIFRLRSD